MLSIKIELLISIHRYSASNRLKGCMKMFANIVPLIIFNWEIIVK